jgi:hypothetical protein
MERAMRALPDLAPLAESPSVFAQPTDDWNGIFASEFASSAGEQGYLDGTTPGVFAGMDPISQAIDGLSSALDLAGDVLDLLSGDLDLVNLDPVILDYQTQDNLLEAGLNNFTIDQTSILNGFLADLQPLWQAFLYVINEVWNALVGALNYVIALIEQILADISATGGGGISPLTKPPFGF